MKEKLPPLPEEAFDGEKFTTEIKETKCTHAKAKIIQNELRCSCGAAWSGSNIQTLFALLTKTAS